MTSKIGVKKIQYPNGTDILTLDSSGSLAIADSATVGGTLDITGNVGLGGANTSSYLQGVVGGKTVTIGDASQASSTLVLKDDDGVFDIATTGGTFRIYDDNNERLRIHSSGALTIPNQPAFAAYRDAGDTTTVTDFIFNQVVFNIGNHYNSSNGRFTAPIAGRYQFNVMMSHNGANTGNVGFFRPQKNSGSQSWLFPIGPNIDHYSIGMSFVIDLAVNDYISVNTGTSTQMLGSGNIHNHFSGYFIG